MSILIEIIQNANLFYQFYDIDDNQKQNKQPYGERRKKMKPETMMIDDVKYVRGDTIKNNAKAENKDGMEYVIVRSYDAGVFAGYLKEKDRENAVAVLVNARRLWRWSGAASLSQLCIDGVANKSDCKFPESVPKVELYRVCEILQVSETAKKTIDEVPIWKA